MNPILSPIKKLDPNCICSLALKIETLAQRVYDQGSRKERQPAFAKLCRNLADQERSHQQFFVDIANRTAAETRPDFFTWLVRGASTDDFIMQVSEQFEAQVIHKLMLDIDPDTLAKFSAQELLEFAINLEEASVTLYSELERHVKAPHKRFISEMANEERNHLQTLLRLKYAPKMAVGT